MIKKLQNNFTTPEQSKRLLELGVPADSADCSIDEWGRVHKIPQENGNLLFSQLKRQTIYTIRPCWSVGRLIEIMALCYKFDLPDSGSVQIYATDIKKRNVIDVLISDIERFINKFNFSKLEE